MSTERMGDPMAEKEKHDSVLDTVLAGYINRVVKVGVRKGLPLLEQHNPELYGQIYDLYHSDERVTVEAFEAAFRIALGATEVLVDKIPVFPHVFKRGLDEGLGDAVSEIADYFKNQAKEPAKRSSGLAAVAPPENETPEQATARQAAELEARKKAAGEVAARMRDYLFGHLKASVEYLVEQFNFVKRFGTGNRDRFLNNLLRMPDAIEPFRALYESFSPDEKRLFRLHITLVDEPSEIAKIQAMTPEERKNYFDLVFKMKQFDPPEWLRATWEWLNEETDRLLIQINEILSQFSQSFIDWADRDLAKMKQDRYRPEMLKMHPERLLELDPTDQRRTQFERQRGLRRDAGKLISILIALAAIAFLGGSFVIHALLVRH